MLDTAMFVAPMLSSSISCTLTARGRICNAKVVKVSTVSHPTDPALYSLHPSARRPTGTFMEPFACVRFRGVKKGDRYVSLLCGNVKRKTPVERNKTSFAYSDVFHFLIRGAKSAVLEVLLKEDEKIGKDKVVGSFKVR